MLAFCTDAKDTGLFVAIAESIDQRKNGQRAGLNVSPTEGLLAIDTNMSCRGVCRQNYDLFKNEEHSRHLSFIATKKKNNRRLPLI